MYFNCLQNKVVKHIQIPPLSEHLETRLFGLYLVYIWFLITFDLNYYYK